MEPLRHHQASEILLRILKKEIKLDELVESGVVKTYFPLHKYSQIKIISQEWMKSRAQILFRNPFRVDNDKRYFQFFSMLSFYFGIQQGFYFGLIAQYNEMLSLLAVYGVFISAYLYIPYFEGDVQIAVFLTSVVVSLWSTLFLVYWKIREKELSYSFGVFEKENIPEIRPEYKGKSVIDPALKRITKAITSHAVRTTLVS